MGLHRGAALKVTGSREGNNTKFVFWWENEEREKDFDIQCHINDVCVGAEHMRLQCGSRLAAERTNLSLLWLHIVSDPNREQRF